MNMNLKRIFIYALLISGLAGCTVADFEENYADPSKLAETTVGKQFTGMIMASSQSVLPTYWDNFVIKRITSNRYSQAVGWVNVDNQYVPGGSAVNDRWNSYYNFMFQYRELQKVHDGLTDINKLENRVFMVAAATYFYDQTQQMVDLYGDIPWSKAGMLSINGGDYSKSYAGYDKASDIYKKMLDDLAGFATELSTLQINAAVTASFKTQDLINNGNVEMWRRYINSLRLKMLTRVSGTSEFSARAKTEIGAILSNPSQFPIVAANGNNIMWDIFTLGTLIDVNSFRSGLEDWNGNIAGKAILDQMVSTSDPRLTYIFQPGVRANAGYLGLDPLLNPTVQDALILTQTLSFYNFSTISRNQYFPGILLTAAEVHLLAAEFYLKENQDANAKMHYEEAIKQSIGFYVYLRSISNNTESPAPVVPTQQAVNSYLSGGKVSWDAASGMNGKLSLIAGQKWLHLNVIQSYENWHEIRRIGKLDLKFWVDNSNQQSVPPSRWLYPGSEQLYNMENYSVVQPQDKLTNLIFWDIN